MPYALLSEYHRLSPTQKSAVTHLIPDDGEWTDTQIATYIANDNPNDTPEQEELGR